MQRYHSESKKSAIATLVFAAAVLIGPAAQAAEGDLWISPASQDQEESQNFTVEVHADAGTSNIGAFDLSLTFDPDYISVNTGQGSSGIADGADTSGFTTEVVSLDSENGVLRFAGYGDAVSGTGIHLVTIYLSTSAGFTSGSTSLGLTISDLLNEFSASLQSGTITGAAVDYPDPGDITAPTLAEVTPVPTPTSDSTPNYTFSSNEAGTITYGGSCSSSTPSATVGNNTITFNALSDGTYSNCTIRVTDAASNVSSPLSVTTFVVDTTVPDTTPPVRSNGSPSGALAAGTTQTTLSLTTNENATCKYSSVSGVAYGSMTNIFSSTGTHSHSTTISGLTDGNAYLYYVRCLDGASNANSNDFSITFSINDEEDVEEIDDEQEEDDADEIEVDTPSSNLDIDRPELKFDGGSDYVQFSSSKKVYSKNKKFTFKGKTDGLSNGTVRVYLDGDVEEEEDIDRDGTWKAKVKVKKDDTYEFKIKYYDSNGSEVDSHKYKVEVDTEDPEFSDLPLFLNKRRGEVVWWVAKDDGKDVKRYKVEFLGKIEKLKNKASIVIPADAPQGLHTLKVRAYDKANNKTTRYVMVRIR